MRRSLEEAARRINALLAELKTSHTGLLTPDDVDYYILMAVFGGASMPQEEFDDRFWGAGVTYAGIGIFSVRIDGRDFVDAVLEGSPGGAGRPQGGRRDRQRRWRALSPDALVSRQGRQQCRRRDPAREGWLRQRPCASGS